MPDEPEETIDLNSAFFLAGSLLGFSLCGRCQDQDREWHKEASIQLKLLADHYATMQDRPK